MQSRKHFFSKGTNDSQSDEKCDLSKDQIPNDKMIRKKGEQYSAFENYFCRNQNISNEENSGHKRAGEPHNLFLRGEQQVYKECDFYDTTELHLLRMKEKNNVKTSFIETRSVDRIGEDWKNNILHSNDELYDDRRNMATRIKEKQNAHYGIPENYDFYKMISTNKTSNEKYGGRLEQNNFSINNRNFEQHETYIKNREDEHLFGNNLFYRENVGSIENNLDRVETYNGMCSDPSQTQQTNGSFQQKFWYQNMNNINNWQNISTDVFQTRGHVYRTIKLRDKKIVADENKGDNICGFCKTTITTLWRKAGHYVLCNACGLYYKAHGVKRPAFLLSNFIKRRKRKTRKVLGQWIDK